VGPVRIEPSLMEYDVIAHVGAMVRIRVSVSSLYR